MLIKQIGRKLSSTWYTKATDTGLTMNFNFLAPLKFKQSVVSVMIHRIVHACSSWKAVHESETNSQKYPVSFYEPIIKKVLESVIIPKELKVKWNQMNRYHIK